MEDMVVDMVEGMVVVDTAVVDMVVVDTVVDMVAVMDMVEGTVITNYFKILFLNSFNNK
jgi:hypothetical protein